MTARGSHGHGPGHAGSASAAPALPELEGEALGEDYLAVLRELCEHTIVFNQTLGLTLDTATADRLRVRLPMRPELIGHPGHHRMHGGVISATLDVVGGLTVMAALGHRHRDEPVAARQARFSRLGTIDLRVDYLRPAVGAHFYAVGEVLRLGGRVASTRMGFHDAATGVMLSAGTGAYIVS